MTQTFACRELRSLITPAGQLRVSVETVEVQVPGPGEVVVQVEASPLNPSDIGLLFGPADISTLRTERGPGGPVLVADIPQPRVASQAKRLGVPMKIGNEGCGTVVAAGPDLAHLMGRRVSMWGGAMYTQFRLVPISDCIVLPDGSAAADGASLLINPMTVLCMIETMRSEGHRAIVHTAAASNLGQMLARVCRAEDIPLVNIVRREDQVALLRDPGASHVVLSTAPDFMERLTDAVTQTGATIGFDALGGGTIGSSILTAMEAAASRTMTQFNRYGSETHKQLYVYGGLDTSPMTLTRSYGMAWGIGGWLVFSVLKKIDPATQARMRDKIVTEMHTTFSSHYSRTIGFDEMIAPDIAVQYERKSTGEKFLLDPSRV